MATLAIGTVATAAVTWLHAARRYRQQHSDPDLHFLMALTIGGDAIASVAILWQIFPLFAGAGMRLSIVLQQDDLRGLADRGAGWTTWYFGSRHRQQSRGRDPLRRT